MQVNFLSRIPKNFGLQYAENLTKAFGYTKCTRNGFDGANAVITLGKFDDGNFRMELQLGSFDIPITVWANFRNMREILIYMEGYMNAVNYGS